LGVSPRPAASGFSTVVYMADVRPLRELLTDLVGDAGAHPDGAQMYLAEHGHADLPPELVAEAVVSFADTAPPEVAEQLAPFVTAHTAGDEAGDWFDLLTSMPLGDTTDTLDGAEEPWSADDFDSDPGQGLDFGAGAVDALDAPASLPDETPTTTPTDWPTAEEQSSPEAEIAVQEAFADVDLAMDPDEDPLD
jgi:hypothetical protein